MIEIIQFVALGLVVGVMSGILGVGGAIFLIPALIYLLGWDQHLAQGTSLATLVPPIGILAAWQYYQAGHVNIKVAALLCLGFFVGGYFGGLFANQLPAEALRKIFGVALLFIAIHMIVGK
ncbi:MAG: sulfite exporter TauE/SafE family protein [Ignavibacteriae bacterium]|nr:sulfite exporter TauE/SafE family protein [Ignavibacteriota bacterium]